jgi:hypothetical protein
MREGNMNGAYLLLGSVGMPSVDHRDDDGESPWGSTHEESGDIAEAESSGEGRLIISRHSAQSSFGTYEESVKAESNNIGSQGEHQNVNLGVLESHEQTVESALLGGINISLSDVFLHSHPGDQELLLGETLGVGRQVGKDKCGYNMSALDLIKRDEWLTRDSHSHSDCSFNPEQPSPSGVTERALHVRQAED